jgi:hypothetical protein
VCKLIDSGIDNFYSSADDELYAECEEYAVFLWEVIFTSRDMFLTDQVLLESSYVGNG